MRTASLDIAGPDHTRISLCAFVGIADEVLEGDTLRFDRWLLLALRASGDPGDPLGPACVEEMFRDFTALGGIGVLGLLTVASVGYLWLTGQRRVAVFLSLAIAGGLLLSLALKTGFHRPTRISCPMAQ
jgi:undecaprenyl-diphosphatase